MRMLFLFTNCHNPIFLLPTLPTKIVGDVRLESATVSHLYIWSIPDSLRTYSKESVSGRLFDGSLCWLSLVHIVLESVSKAMQLSSILPPALTDWVIGLPTATIGRSGNRARSTVSNSQN